LQQVFDHNPSRMQPTPVIAVFDLGKTNKKIFLFSESYELVWERSVQLNETIDEDGFPCENLAATVSWVMASLQGALAEKQFEIRALNFSTYGASFVHINGQGDVLTPLYNYLKPYPESLARQFYNQYGPPGDFSLATASPALGSLNAGLQLYRLKHEQPELFEKIAWSLHLPQFLSSLFTKRFYSDITSIGCHTALWEFAYNNYHPWVTAESVLQKLAPIFPSNEVMNADVQGHALLCGAGLHDSSSALIPYLMNFTEPFILISTGTWNISLNPFNHIPLEKEELQKDCLCFLSYQGEQVKASRLFAGFEHEQVVKKLSAHFTVSPDYYKSIEFDETVVSKIRTTTNATSFSTSDLSGFGDFTTAYHCLIMDIVAQQKHSTALLLKGTPVKRIFVDGGFSKNTIFMYLLAEIFPDMEIYAATVAQASALGAALAIHSRWTEKPIPSDLIELKYYASRPSL